jgi:hypothetical protein
VHRPLGQQRQNCRAHVTAAPAAAATTPSATPAAGAEAEPGAEARAETPTKPRTETGAKALLAGVFTEVFAEFPSALPPGLVQRPAGDRSGAETESWPAGEW